MDAVEDTPVGATVTSVTGVTVPKLDVTSKPVGSTVTFVSGVTVPKVDVTDNPVTETVLLCVPPQGSSPQELLPQPSS